MGSLAMLLLIGLLIAIHEAGHLAAAKLVGIPVAEFSVGFGPKLASRFWRGTEYSLRALPLGGFVVPMAAGAAEFGAYPLRRRLAFFLGGPLANLAATVPLFAVLSALDRGVSLYNLVVAPFGLLAEPGSMSGVVGIVMEGARLAEGGMALELAISLSISLAVLNLLPIPVLDGGQILLACMERVFPRLVRLRVAATLVGAAMVAGVTLYANVQDALRYWG